MSAEKISALVIILLSLIVVFMSYVIHDQKIDLAIAKECRQEKIELLFKMDQIVQRCHSFK